ncbi:hypothetical protein DPEC_G00215000 [Dallia pectoralis]|uniref:Uncharacterized protein n=1 Tax=Dallia pectoralis TaxID=75939 RepID=A0ACC2G2M2_DALPE|nr:hypothetical protein DPEC_G00215000 [Dallia pectoralis]
MSMSWAPGGRRPQPNPNGGSMKPLRSFRRPAPYPVREDRTDDHNKDSESYAEVVQQDFSNNNLPCKGFQQNASSTDYSPADKRTVLYQRFYKQLQEKTPANCVVLSVTNQNMDYPKSIGLCLQDRGLSVEMIYLQAESGLTRALQDVRSDGSPLCILVEQTNVALSSCTVIIFSESLKIHRNMPKDHAMDFVIAEYGRGLVGRVQQKDPTEMGARAAELADDYLEREKVERHAVPSDTRQLLFFLAEGVHLYPDELNTVMEYVRNRQDHLQATSTEAGDGSQPERRKMLPPGLGKPPPLLPTPSGQRSREPPPGMGEHPATPLMTPPGSYPKTKPPPLLSMQQAQGPPHRSLHGTPPPRGPPHGPHGPQPRGPAHHHGASNLRGPPPFRGPPQSGPVPPHGPRGAPPSLQSLHIGPQAGLLPCPGGLPPHPNTPRR